MQDWKDILYKETKDTPLKGVFIGSGNLGHEWQVIHTVDCTEIECKKCEISKMDWKKNKTKCTGT